LRKDSVAKTSDQLNHVALQSAREGHWNLSARKLQNTPNAWTKALPAVSKLTQLCTRGAVPTVACIPALVQPLLVSSASES
jgi:hypothetical protein